MFLINPIGFSAAFLAALCTCLEVTVINKQKFLTELGRLLTFMSEEDRQEALTLYEKMFEDTDDEQALLQALLSPTRQTVIIARAYDANARKLQAYASAQRKTSAHEEPEATPDFVMAILRVYEEAVPLPVEEPVPAPAPAAIPVQTPVPVPVVEEPESPAVDPDQFSLFADDEQPAVPAEEDGAAASDPLDEVDSFITDFSIVDDELAEPVGETREIPLEAEEDIPPAAEESLPLELPVDEIDETEEEEPEPRSTETVRKPRIALLALFILVATPLTLIVSLILLIPTLLSLLLAALSIVGGCAGVVAAFSGFPVFADILIVLGCSIIVLALGLLFLWLFIWFVGAVIGGLIRWVLQLGGQWCFKEVAA